MNSFLEFYKKSELLHHAIFFIEDKIDEAVFELKKFIRQSLGFNISGNPDFYHRKFENFTIDDARFVTDNENRKSLLGGKKIFIIETDFITLEAQNALLKVFEEPSRDTHFFIISPQDILIPTLKSRMQIFGSLEEDKSVLKNSKTILDMDMKERLEIVKEIVDGIKDEEMTKQDAISFLNKVEKTLYEKGVEETSSALLVCQKTRESLYDRGAPIKMILENLVLSL